MTELYFSITVTVVKQNKKKKKKEESKNITQLLIGRTIFFSFLL